MGVNEFAAPKKECVQLKNLGERERERERYSSSDFDPHTGWQLAGSSESGLLPCERQRADCLVGSSIMETVARSACLRQQQPLVDKRRRSFTKTWQSELEEKVKAAV